MSEKEPLIPKHGGYRKLKSFQMAQLVYDVTVRFCHRYVEKRSRTHDQMVQAARSGVQNIAEGSQAAGPSKKTELKLTNVARASLEELRLDYEDFLRQRSLLLWDRRDLRRDSLISRRCSTSDCVAKWVQEQHGLGGRSGLQPHAKPKPSQSTESTSSTKSILSTYPELAANAALVLIAVACSLLDRQLAFLADAFNVKAALQSVYIASAKRAWNWRMMTSSVASLLRRRALQNFSQSAQAF